MKKIGYGVVGLGTFLLLWQLFVSFGNYNETLFPPPLDVGKAFIQLTRQGILWTGIKSSLIRFVFGYGLALVSGVTLGLFFGKFTWIWNFLNPIVQVLRPISPIAWLPFIVLWFGIGDIPAIVIIFIAAFYPVLLSTVVAVRRVDKSFLRVAENFELKPIETITKIVFPAAFPSIITSFHMALGSAWVFLVAGEMVGAQTGLGYLVVDARNNMRLDNLIAAMITIGVLGLILDSIIGMVEGSVLQKWGHKRSD